MADLTAKWRIEGQNGMQSAFRSILGDAQSTANRVSGVFKTAFAGLSFVTITTGLVRAGAAAIEFGDEMQKASARTGIGAGEFSKLAGAAKLADVEVGALSTALRTMQRNVSEAGSGAKGPLEVFRALGIEFEEFRKLRPDVQFEVLAEQISRLKDPADRTRAAVELFGRAGADLLPMFEDGAEGIRKAREEVERLGGSLTDEEIRKLADADDAIKRLSTSWAGLARTLTAAAAPALSEFFDILRKGTGGGSVVEDLTDELDELNRMIEKLDKLPADRRADPINQNIYKRRRIVEARLAELGVYEESKGPGRRGNAPTAPAAPPGFEGATAAEKKATASRFEMSEDTKRWLEAANERWRRVEEGLELQRDIGETLGRDLEETTRVLGAQVEASLDAALELSEKVSPFAAEAAANIQSQFAEFLFDPFADGLDGMVKGFADTLRRMAAEAAASELLKMFFSWAGGLGGGAGAFFTSMGSAIGVKDAGGFGAAGKPQLIGTGAQPELFVPSTAGTFYPRGAYGAGGGLALTVAPVYNIDARGASQELVKMLPAILERTKQETVALTEQRLRDNIKRRGRI